MGYIIIFTTQSRIIVTDHFIFKLLTQIKIYNQPHIILLFPNAQKLDWSNKKHKSHFAVEMEKIWLFFINVSEKQWNTDFILIPTSR